jgi:Yip1 domain
MNNFQLATALVLDPKGAMREIEARPRFLFPLLVTVLASGVALVWYYSIVDAAWLIDTSLRSSSRPMTEEQLAQVSRFMTRNTLMYGGLFSVVFISVVFRLLESTWYLLAGKVTNVQRTFKQFFALACWTSLPQVLAVLPAIPLLLTAQSPQTEPGALSPLSLNELFFHRAMGAAGYNLFSNINLLHIFTVFLVVLGIKMWSGRSWLFAAVYTLLPAALIGGVWALVALK